MCIVGGASGIASKLAENIKIFPPKYQHFENSAYLTIGIKQKGKKKKSSQIFQFDKA